MSIINLLLKEVVFFNFNKNSNGGSFKKYMKIRIYTFLYAAVGGKCNVCGIK